MIDISMYDLEKRREINLTKIHVREVSEWAISPFYKSRKKIWNINFPWTNSISSLAYIVTNKNLNPSPQGYRI